MLIIILIFNIKKNELIMKWCSVIMDAFIAIKELVMMGKPADELINNFVNEYQLECNDIYFIIQLDETLSVEDIKKILHNKEYQSWDIYRNSINTAIYYDNVYVLDKLLQSNIFLPKIIRDKIIWGRFFEKWNCFEFIKNSLKDERYDCFQIIHDYYCDYVCYTNYYVYNYKKKYYKGSLMYEVWNFIIDSEIDNKKLDRILKYLNDNNLLFRKELKDYHRFEYFINFCRKMYITDRVKILNKYNICIFKQNVKIKNKLDSYYSERLNDLYHELEIEIP